MSAFLSNSGGVPLRTVSLGASLKLLMQNIQIPTDQVAHHFSELPLVFFNVFNYSVCYHILFVLTHVSRFFFPAFYYLFVLNRATPVKLPLQRNSHFFTSEVGFWCVVTGTLGNHCAATLSVKTINLKQDFRLKPPLPDSGKLLQIKLI